MSDAWAELQALKSKRLKLDSRRRMLQERKKERQDILNNSLVTPGKVPTVLSSLTKVDTGVEPTTSIQSIASTSFDTITNTNDSQTKPEGESFADDSFEDCFLRCLCDAAVHLPVDSRQLLATVNKSLGSSVTHDRIVNLLEKFAVQQLISVEERVSDDSVLLEVVTADHTKLAAMATSISPTSRKRKAEQQAEDENGDVVLAEDNKKPKENDVLSLLSLASTREKENKRIGEEILELLSRPSAKEKTLAEQFKSIRGTTVQEFCPHGTKSECRRISAKSKPCTKLHFRKIIQSHTDETLGDCSFLNTCFHMESCKYVHYEVDTDKKVTPSASNVIPSGVRLPSATTGQLSESISMESKAVLHPPQWVHCDLRFFDMTTLGKFSVIMADPPWDIHMNLPYGTMSDDEMRQLNIPALQDEGLIFLWVTGRAMELGRECLQLWGYERVDELIWVKTNQLQRIIRTGRTGHWLNHGKEHCLVGMKGNPPVNRGLDCDVIVAEVRATSHKPDEVYGIIERLSPGTRKIELFGRPHNIQPNWMTLGNQLDGLHLVEEEVRGRFYNRYPDGDCMVKPK